MDRRQLLFGMTALGLATNFNLNHLSAQVGMQPWVTVVSPTAIGLGYAAGQDP